MNRDRWRDIRTMIEQDIMDGVLEPGTKLPTEPELAALYGSGRHSVRRAIAELAKTGHLSVEQGRGTFVQTRPRLEYQIGRRTRMRKNLEPHGVDITGELLGIEKITANGRVAKSLNLTEGAPVIVTRRITFADGLPVSFGALYHDATKFSAFPERRQSLGSVTAVYESYGITDYLRGRTEIHSRPARQDEAKMLKQHPDMPVLVLRAVDRTQDGAALAYSEVIWSSARVKFSINLEDI
ncbi:MAG: phosphonate metabolism transcriptional regulator PhnF [Pelagimonas sp.]|uniref:phosphonate metabolism transcriptional regulator PhnF n=1 Tax=Pelagimonas sp. TaxID=2073170 RepID=UPI003D6C6F95